ncbi:unnamed protein product [Anisakis simplex]|uniref:SHSP domain-containing protein n=1 Tax=Anisakis simplex TaxID=6269 RepID=A0A0M3JN46_ANISI|nr:unnamed protein product [Anisakis simplex]
MAAAMRCLGGEASPKIDRLRESYETFPGQQLSEVDLIREFDPSYPIDLIDFQFVSGLKLQCDERTVILHDHHGKLFADMRQFKGQHKCNKVLKKLSDKGRLEIDHKGQVEPSPQESSLIQFNTHISSTF